VDGEPAVRQTQFTGSQSFYNGNLSQARITQEGASFAAQTTIKERAAKEDADAGFV
jgi:hypothetical protein